MLCNLKTNNRPDKKLQNALLKLALALILLTLSLIWFFLAPSHLLYTTTTTSLITIYCLITAIKTLTAGEAAISYGGFANEIIHNDFKMRRIENPYGECVIENSPAKELIKNTDVLSFLNKYIAEGANNKSALYRLQTATQNLSSEKVTLSLLLKQNSTRIFNDLEYFEVSIRPIYLKKPKIFDGAFSVKKIKKETYFYWTLNNITSKQNMDYVFKEECSSLHNFLDYMPVGLYTIDKDYVINYTNHNMASFLGLNPHQLLGSSLHSFLTSDSTLPLKKDFWHGPLHFIKHNGEVTETYVFQSSYREKEKIMLRGVVIHQLPTPSDLQQQINKSLDDVNWLFNNSPIGILFVNEQGIIINSNPKASDLFKIETDNSNLLIKLPPEGAKALQQAFQKAKQCQNSVSIELKTKETSLNIYISALHHLHQKNSSLGTQFIIYAIDVTKQKNLEVQFAQAQKMQAVGQLAGGVAHDFNNLLTAMIGFTDLLLQRHGVGDPSFADLIQIKQNANRATSLVRQLLAFSRKQPLLPKLIDITDNFADLSQMLKRILGEKIKLTFNHGNDLGFVKVDPNQFSQVIINLAVNAKDAMNGNGSLHISTSTFRLSEKYIFGDDTIMPGDFVVIDVTDTGCGIPPENINRIFDPFFSTKENIVGSGTGLGLAMVYGIVRQTEGFIKVASTIGKGTTFSIYLPRFETGPEEENSILASPIITDSSGQTILQVQETLSAPANINQKIIMGLNITNTIDRSHTAPAKGSRPARILFVEDEDSVRAFGVRALKKKGYTVIDSNSAENALDILEKDTDFDLLLTDMVLPGISGAQLTNKVKEKLPQISVILASGYSEDIARKEVDNTNEFEFITKPYSLGDLTAKVFDVLNRNQDGK
ncbi:MAG: response regulator [Alphaproteobacteria bacterium]|nr:response regulator [Alphaproteobacteria bacterium]